MIDSGETLTQAEAEDPAIFVDLAAVEFGQQILVAATRLSDDRNSTINLITKMPNIALHMSIRKDKIVRTYREGENFDKESEVDENLSDPNNKQPVKAGKPFLLAIFVNHENFHIAFDEKDFCTFKHRLPFKDITRLILRNLTYVTQIDQWSLHPKKWPPIPYQGPDTIFSNDIPRLFQLFHRTVITGKFASTEGHFDIHFQAKNTSRELLLMRITVGKNTIELKAMNENGKYVNEEKKSYPFVTNRLFRIGISCIEGQFAIAIDGQEICTYKYVDKDLLDKMTGLKIRTSKGFKLDLCAVDHEFINPKASDLALSTELPITSRQNDSSFQQLVTGLPCPMSFAHSIIIEGVAGDQTSFPKIALNKKDSTTVVLGLLVSFPSNMIGRNTFVNNAWGNEEDRDNLFDPKVTNPMVPGKEFKICITAGHDKFYIAVNDRPFCTYKHRLPIEEVTVVDVRSMQKVKRVDHHTPLPYPWPPKQAFMIGKEFANDVAVKFKPGHVVVLGAYTRGKGWFTIDFYDKVFERNLIHFNVRYDECVVARAWKNEKCEFKDWDQSGGFPFRLNGEFRISIGFTKDEFLFAVNGAKFCSYKYHDQVLDMTTGLKLSVDKGQTVDITEVDHVQLSPDCNGYEDYSKLPVYPDGRVCPRIGRPV